MKTPQRPVFRVALTADFYDEAGKPKFADLGLGTFEGHEQIRVSKFNEHRPEISPDQLADCHGVIVMTPKVSVRLTK